MIKRLSLFALLITSLLVSAAAEGNPAMILYNVTPAAFDDGGIYVSPLDQYGRAGPALAIISSSSIDSEQRQDISMFSPAGFQTKTDDRIDGGSLYHRCHLIGAQLASGTACAENLVTGTQYLNIVGMLPIENRARTYALRTGEHLLYKVTPIYQGAELLPRAVEITIYSIESAGLRMTAYCYNVQPGFVIDYSTGFARAEDEPEEFVLIADGAADPGTRAAQAEPDYVLNTKSMRFHFPWCTGVETMNAKNRQDYYGDRETLIAQGYKPCGSCNP